MKKRILIFLLCLPSLVWAAGGHNEHVVKADIKPTDKESLYRGAVAFMAHCSGCHSSQYQRYERIGDDLGLTEKQTEGLILTQNVKIGDQIISALPIEKGEAMFGAPPPDLTLITRVKRQGPDWLYSYLKTFYADPERPFGVNNLVFPLVAMPHVLEPYQGVPKLQDDGTIIATGGSMTSEEYDQMLLDITNFLAYSADPVKVKRERMGYWVIGFLVIFFILAYLLKREYWRDVH